MSEHLEAAHRALRSAELLLGEGDPAGAANRAYYAIFYTARGAVVHVTGINVNEVKTHLGLRRLFDQHVVKAGLVSRDVAAHFADVESSRIASDCRGDRLQTAEIEAAIREATEFVGGCEDVVRRHEP